MRIPFTKMHGAGNDFVVLDETRGPLGLTAAQYRWLANRHMGVGADQILIVGPPPDGSVDFSYRIVNADGGEVEHCGNGARCFVRYVRETGLTGKTSIRVRTLNQTLTLTEQTDGNVTVDMGEPVFEHLRIPFVARDLPVQAKNGLDWFELPCPALENSISQANWHIVQHPRHKFATFLIATVSMGNPHAVQLVADADATPVQVLGPIVQANPAFPQGVNVGFMQIESRSQVRLRVYERGAGETLACGTGACAAVVCGIQSGLLDARVAVHMAGGVLHIEWLGLGHAVLKTGPAQTVFSAQVDVPELA